MREVVTSSRPDIVCLQETKMATISPSTILSTLGADFDQHIFFACIWGFKDPWGDPDCLAQGILPGSGNPSGYLLGLGEVCFGGRQ